MSKYISDFIDKLKNLKEKPSKDLLNMIYEWNADFEKDKFPLNHIDQTKAKNKYILQRWNEYENSKKKTRLVHGSYEDEINGMYY